MSANLAGSTRGALRARRHIMQVAPDAAQLARGSEAGAFRDTFHVEPRLREKLLRERRAQPVAVVGDVHADMLAEQPRKMARARSRDAREALCRPRLRRVRSDRVLHAMYRRMNVVAPFEPGRELRVAAAASQVNDKIARDR